MELNDLKVFLKLADNLHFGQTAKEFYISPSSLTRIIQGLEEELDVALFERDNRTVFLTQDGHRFKSTANEMLQSYSEFYRKADGGQLKGRIRFYCSVTASYSILPKYLKTFHQKNQLVDVELETGSVESSVAKLLKGDADMAISILDEQLMPSIESKIISKIPIVFIGPKKVSGSNRESNDSIDSQPQQFILPPKGPIREAALKWLNEQKNSVQALTHANSYEAVISLVSSGVGISVVPKQVLEFSSLKEDVEVLKNRGTLCTINAGLIVLKKNRYHPIIQEFWNCF